MSTDAVAVRKLPASAVRPAVCPGNRGRPHGRHQAYEERRSILDDVANEAKSLDKKLGKGDKRKLDEYLSSVRETEKQVARMRSWVDKPKSEVKETGFATG